MQFKVPKFLEREARIVGSLTFKQLAYFGVAGIILLILWFTLPKSLFIIFFFLIGGGAFSLVFLKIEGVPLINVIPQYFGFLGSARTYIWQKKETLTPIKLVQKPREEKKKTEEASLKVSPESKLRKLSSKIELGEFK
jgi:hypothetical protein